MNTQRPRADLTDYAQTRATYTRPPEARPAHDTPASLADWIVGPARHIESALMVFDEFCWRLVAAGFPVLRVSLHTGTLHPQFLGSTLSWWRTTGLTAMAMIEHEVLESPALANNPFRLMIQDGKVLRRKLEGPDAVLDFSILPELAEKGATDYLGVPMQGAQGTRYGITFAGDRPGGFTAQEVADLTTLSARLPVVIDIHVQRWMAHNVMSAYLGAKTGARVMAGQIRRGMGEEMTAVLWSSDLRGFTERSDRLEGERMIAILNALFDAQAAAIHRHGGEILKFIGDGLLAMFPIADAGFAGTAARNALEAAAEAHEAVAALADDAALAGEPPLRIVVALHAGLVTYGNIGAAERLDFTVIGPAVNLVSRIEAVAKALDRPTVVSEEFARAYGRPMAALGEHALKGLAAPRALFAPLETTMPAPA